MREDGCYWLKWLKKLDFHFRKTNSILINCISDVELEDKLKYLELN